MFSSYRIFLSIFFILSSFAVIGQEIPFSWNCEYRNGKIEVKVKVALEHYLYRDKTVVQLSDAGGVAIFADSLPVSMEYRDEFGDKYEIFPAGEHVWQFPRTSSSSYNAKIEYQGCAKKPFVCYPPGKEVIPITVEREKSRQVNLINTVNENPSPPQQDANPVIKRDALNSGLIGKIMSGGGIFLVIGAFFGGILSTLTPCVFPMIPITLAILGAGKDAGRRQAFKRSFFYVCGIVITFTSLAFAASLSGKAFGTQILGNPVFMLAFAAIFALLSFSMLGLYELQLPASWQLKLNRIGGGTDTGSFMMGLAAGFVAVPCTGPVLAALIGIAAIDGNHFFGAFLLGSYAVGFGIPFLFIGAGIGKMPRGGPYMDMIKSVLGIAILAIANFAVFIALPQLKSFLSSILPLNGLFPIALLASGFLMGAVHSDGHSRIKIVRILKVAGAFLIAFSIYWVFTATSSGDDKIGIQWSYSLEESLRRSRSEGKNIFIDFTAEWCAACKEMDALTFSNSKLADEINLKWIPVRIDATRNSPEIVEILKRYGVKGFPTVLLMRPDGRVDEHITGFVSAEELLKLAE